MKKQNLSIIIPVYNEEETIQELIERINTTLTTHNISYEIIVIDDHSTDNTYQIVQKLAITYPIQLHQKMFQKGKAQSLREGFKYARFETICMIDADLQYPPEAIPFLVSTYHKYHGVIVANRRHYHAHPMKKFLSRLFTFICGRLLHQLTCDVQAGLKVFSRELAQRIPLKATEWSFDLEFLLSARSAGHSIVSVDITFKERKNGKGRNFFLRVACQIVLAALHLKMQKSAIVPLHPDDRSKKGEGFHYRGIEFIHHGHLHHSESAFHRFGSFQQWVFFSLLALIVLGFLQDWHRTLIILIAILTILYFADLLFNFYLIYRSFSKAPEIDITDEEIARVPESDWPSYTILCPLYREWTVIPQFVRGIEKLDYPKNKLQVLFLLEEDDQETIDRIKKYSLPAHFSSLVLPHSLPKTKPKALNFGLSHATGEYIVIFDAEDIPEPDQLKKAVVAFENSDARLACVQAKLNFYNPHQNILTRIFTAEYSLWFDLVLTGLQSLHAPIPLGGTSNHFRTVYLKLLHGWDAFNVTEDCDLGMRLVKRGYRTAIINSLTYEEANSNLLNWFHQRTRWIKGYMQTYLVHMRRPGDFIRHWKEPHVITFQLIVGGKVLSMFINPLMWLTTISYFCLRPIVGPFIESLYPTPILYMGIFSLVFGNFLYMYYYMIGCAKRGHDDIIKYAFLVPFYWLFMSIAAWKALYDMVKRPHFWPKTIHGFHLSHMSSSPLPGVST